MRMALVVPLLGFMSFSLAAFMPQSVDTSRSGMLYGHFTLGAHIDRVEIAPIAGVRRPSANVLPNGDFYFADLAPGQYVVARVEVDGTWRDLVSDRGVGALTVTVDAGAINYAGAWELEAGATDSYSVFPSDRPGSDVLLKRLRFSLRGTGWEKQIP
jgi:hypothetical protein